MTSRVAMARHKLTAFGGVAHVKIFQDFSAKHRATATDIVEAIHDIVVSAHLDGRWSPSIHEVSDMYGGKSLYVTVNEQVVAQRWLAGLLFPKPETKIIFGPLATDRLHLFIGLTVVVNRGWAGSREVFDSFDVPLAASDELLRIVERLRKFKFETSVYARGSHRAHARVSA